MEQFIVSLNSEYTQNFANDKNLFFHLISWVTLQAPNCKVFFGVGTRGKFIVTFSIIEFVLRPNVEYYEFWTVEKFSSELTVYYNDFVYFCFRSWPIYYYQNCSRWVEFFMWILKWLFYDTVNF